MTNETKRRAIIFLVLTALITVLLAAAMPQLELQKGVPLPANNGQSDDAGIGAAGPPLSINTKTFLASVLGLILLMMMIYLVINRRHRLTLRDILQALKVIVIVSLALSLLMYGLSNVQINMAPTAVEVLPLEVVVVPGPALAPVPESLLLLVWVGLGGTVLLLVIMMARARIRTRVVQDPLALEAEHAVEALKAGQSFSNVIIRCYEQMSQILKKEQGLTLEKTMTAREFEALLEKRGVPGPPVRQLTQLFEIARYAARTPGPVEEAQAVDCLNAIARFGHSSAKKEPGQAK